MPPHGVILRDFRSRGIWRGSAQLPKFRPESLPLRSLASAGWHLPVRIKYCTPSRSLHETARVFPRGSADGQAVHLKGWNADSDGNGLSVFAAGADAFIELQIIAYHGHTSKNVWAVADQSGALDRGGDVAVLDKIGFRGGENEFAVGDVHLAAAEVYRVHAALDRTDDVLGIILARQHISIRHTRHGNVFVAFAAAVAGICHSHQPGGKFVAQVPLQDSVLYQHSVLGGVTFVVYVQRAPSPGHGAVVHDGTFFAGNALADEPGKS